MADPVWTYGPKTVSFGSRRGVVGRLFLTGSGVEDVQTPLRRVQAVQIQGIQGTTDNIFNVFRNTLGTQDNLNDAPGNIHLVNISGGAGANYSVIITGY